MRIKVKEMETKLLVTPKDIKPTSPNFRVRGALNPGGVRLADGKILLFARIAETPKHGEKFFLAPRFTGNGKTKMIIEKIPRHECRWNRECFITHQNIARLPTISHFRKILLDRSGMEVERISAKPDFAGAREDGDFGVEDPRITFLDDRQEYAMTYVSVSMSSGISTSLALSSDLNRWERKGIIFRQQNKDAAIFPEKFSGHYVALHRPEGTMIFDKPRIWLSYSSDLEYWGKDRPIIAPRENSWDEVRIGTGAVPLKTEEGWLLIYHGVHLEDRKKPDSEKVYEAGAVILHADKPEKVVARTPRNAPLFAPEHEFEKNGFKRETVFPTTAIPTKDMKSLLIYSGAADSNIEVRKMKLKEILGSLEWKSK